MTAISQGAYLTRDIRRVVHCFALVSLCWRLMLGEKGEKPVCVCLFGGKETGGLTPDEGGSGTGNWGVSTGIERLHQELVGEPFCQITKAERVSSMVAANLSMKEDHRERVGQNANHRQHDQCSIVVLMDGRMFQMAIGGDRLKDLGINQPPTLTEQINKDRGNGIEFHIASEKVGVLFFNRLFDRLLVGLAFMDTNLVYFLGSQSLDHP